MGLLLLSSSAFHTLWPCGSTAIWALVYAPSSPCAGAQVDGEACVGRAWCQLHREGKRRRIHCSPSPAALLALCAFLTSSTVTLYPSQMHPWLQRLHTHSLLLMHSPTVCPRFKRSLQMSVVDSARGVSAIILIAATCTVLEAVLSVSDPSPTSTAAVDIIIIIILVVVVASPSSGFTHSSPGLLLC